MVCNRALRVKLGGPFFLVPKASLAAIGPDSLNGNESFHSGTGAPGKRSALREPPPKERQNCQIGFIFGIHKRYYTYVLKLQPGTRNGIENAQRLLMESLD